MMLCSLQHPFQLFHPSLNLYLQIGEAGEYLLRRTMCDLFVHNLFIAVEAKVIALSYQISLRHAKTLRRARTLSFLAFALLPARQNVGKIVLRSLAGTQRRARQGAEFVVTQQRRALVVQRPAVRFHIVEPNLIGAAGVGLSKKQDSG